MKTREQIEARINHFNIRLKDWIDLSNEIESLTWCLDKTEDEVIEKIINLIQWRNFLQARVMMWVIEQFIW